MLLTLCGRMPAQSNCFDYDRCMKAKERFKGAYFMDSIKNDDEKYFSNLIGCPFPDDELTTLDGKKIKTSDLKGNFVVVSFWFTTCQPCIDELPQIELLSKEYAHQNVKFLNITFEERKKIIDFLSAHQASGIIQAYESSDFLEKHFCTLYGYPMCFLLNSKGNVIEGWSGGLPGNEFYNKVKLLIEKNALR